MAFRRVILSGNKVEEAKSDIERLIALDKTKSDFPVLKIGIKPGVKPETIIVDLNGEGADSFSKKVRDLGGKHGVTVAIKNEKPIIKEVIKDVIKEKLK